MAYQYSLEYTLKNKDSIFTAKKIEASKEIIKSINETFDVWIFPDRIEVSNIRTIKDVWKVKRKLKWLKAISKLREYKNEYPYKLRY